MLQLQLSSDQTILEYHQKISKVLAPDYSRFKVKPLSVVGVRMKLPSLVILVHSPL